MSDERFGAIGEVDEKQLRLLVRDWRRGRADRNLLQAMQDAYVMVFALVLIGAMVISSIMQAGPAALGRSRWFPGHGTRGGAHVRSRRGLGRRGFLDHGRQR